MDKVGPAHVTRVTAALAQQPRHQQQYHKHAASAQDNA
jgi:hypothetical protein